MLSSSTYVKHPLVLHAYRCHRGLGGPGPQTEYWPGRGRALSGECFRRVRSPEEASGECRRVGPRNGFFSDLILPRASLKELSWSGQVASRSGRERPGGVQQRSGSAQGAFRNGRGAVGEPLVAMTPCAGHVRRVNVGGPPHGERQESVQGASRERSGRVRARRRGPPARAAAP